MAESHAPGLQGLLPRLSGPIHAVVIIQIVDANYGSQEVRRVRSFTGANEYPAISILHRNFGRDYFNAINVGALKSFAKVSKQPVIAAFHAHIDSKRRSRIHSSVPQ
jgi:hypothetical protein